MRYVRKNQLSGALYFILYIPWGCLEWDLMLNFQGYILLRLVYHLRPLSSHIYCFKCLPALLEVLRQHLIRKWIWIHERGHICKKIFIERILPLKENCRFKCVFFLSSGGAILLTWRAWPYTLRLGEHYYISKWSSAWMLLLETQKSSVRFYPNCVGMPERFRVTTQNRRNPSSKSLIRLEHGIVLSLENKDREIFHTFQGVVRMCRGVRRKSTYIAVYR